MSQTAHHDPKEMTAEEVQVTVDRLPACKIKLTVKASPKIVSAARKSAVKSVSKEVVIPGFRKGKAPEEIILKKFGADVEKQLHKAIADLSFVAAQKVAKVPVLNNNSPITFDLQSQSMESGAELTFSFETEPKVPSVDPKGFQPKPVVKAEVADKQIEEAIHQMRFFYAKWTPVNDRAIQEGDYIMIDLDTIDGEIVQNVFHHIRFEVSAARMANWMKKLVLGARAGDLLEGLSEVDETATAAEKEEFKPKKVRINILKVEEAELPALDDEFAKKVGARDVAHMRQSIFDLLNKQADDKVQTELRDQVNDYIAENYLFDLPQSLIDTEKKHRQAQLLQDPKFRATWQKMSQEERKSAEEKLFDESAQAVRLFYLSRQVVQDAKIPITQAEVHAEANSIFQNHGGKEANSDQISKEIYALALSKVILAKAQDFVISQQKG